mmetsp:Transcript_22230/g.19067  ORF Transcript_22230/g.19067 Transcript_22230/m.19067 type:complete len:109 (+) Transcript_22230:717-1043(+)
MVKDSGSHMGNGIFIMNEEYEEEFRGVYGNGTLCGLEKSRKIVQKYVKPLLLLDRKFDIRMFLLLSSSNPYMAYMHEGFVKLSLHPYDQNSNIKGMFAANTHQSEKFF